LRSKIFFRCGIRMSFRQVRNPQAKNRVETMAIARRSVFCGTLSGTVAVSDWLRVAMARSKGNCCWST